MVISTIAIVMVVLGAMAVPVGLIVRNSAREQLDARLTQQAQVVAQTVTEYPIGKPLFSTRMTRQEMANLTGTSRETFTRVLMDYQDRGLVGIDRNQFILNNESKLKELVV